MSRTKVFMFLWRLSVTGGIPRVVRALVNGLDRDIFDIHVCTARPLSHEDRLDELGKDIQLSSLDITGEPSAIRKLAGSRRLSSLIQSYAPDVVHTHSGVAWYIAPWMATGRRARASTILEIHDSPQSKRVSHLNSAVEGLLLRRLSAVPLVHSTSVKRDLSSAARLDTARIRVIPIGINLAPLQNRSTGPAWRHSLGIGDSEIVITYVARLVASKNPSMFLRVASDVLSQRPNCRFVLIGDGPEAGAIERAAASAHLGDRFLLLRNVADVSDALAASDIFVSTSDYEGFGIAVLEAMAAALPVVSTNAGGIEDLILPEVTGFLTPLGLMAPLVEKVLWLVDSPLDRTRMGTASASRAVRFDVATMVNAYATLYLSLARQSDNTRR